MAGLRVVLDTNVLVSGLAYPAGVPGRILGAWQRGGLDVVLSKSILDEMVRVLPRLSRNQRSAAEIRDLADSFLFMAEIVEPSGDVEVALRDKTDGPVLGTLLAARADYDYLITGDKDLLALGGKYPLVTPVAFWERHGG
jgi:putative PIN family toxin of toxin-antitoxin system